MNGIGRGKGHVKWEGEGLGTIIIPKNLCATELRVRGKKKEKAAEKERVKERKG